MIVARAAQALSVRPWQKPAQNAQQCNPSRSCVVPLQRDAAALLDRAAFDGEEIPSAAVVAQACFADEEARAEFLRAYVDSTSKLLDQYGSRTGTAYRIALAAYPDPGAGEDTKPTKRKAHSSE